MIRKIALVILVCLLVAGCSQQAQLLPFIKDGSGKTDFGDQTFYIASDVYPSETSQISFMSYGATTTNYDAAIARFDAVEEKYNCTLEFVNPINSRDMLLAAASLKELDMVVHPIYYGGFTDIMLGIYSPLSGIPAIDYKDSEKWGSPNMLELFCYDNDIYGVIPASWPDGSIMPLDFVCVINEPMVEKNSMTDPRDLFEQGQWTHETFEETVKRFYNADDPSNIVYGFSGNDRHFVDMSLKSFNVDFVINNNGLYENGYNTDDFISAIEWASKFIGGEYSEMVIFDGMTCVRHWVNDITGIAMVHMNYLCSMGGTGDSSADIILSDKEYGLVPFPSLDGKTIHAQYERVINGIMFPSWSLFNDEMGMIANDIFEPLEGLETLEAQKENLNTYLFFDERDTNLVFDMINEAKYLYHDEGIDELHQKISDSVSKKSAKQIQEEVQRTLNSIIEEYIESGRTSMDAIFGE